MTSNQVVFSIFDFNNCNRMTRFILLGDDIEDPGSHLFDPGCYGVCMICVGAKIHCVCHMAMSS
jgi:hypothetical protein